MFDNPNPSPWSLGPPQQQPQPWLGQPQPYIGTQPQPFIVWLLSLI